METGDSGDVLELPKLQDAVESTRAPARTHTAKINNFLIKILPMEPFEFSILAKALFF